MVFFRKLVSKKHSLQFKMNDINIKIWSFSQQFHVRVLPKAPLTAGGLFKWIDKSIDEGCTKDKWIEIIGGSGWLRWTMEVGHRLTNSNPRETLYLGYHFPPQSKGTTRFYQDCSIFLLSPSSIALSIIFNNEPSVRRDPLFSTRGRG